jgi:diaminopimelate decarboxylase
MIYSYENISKVADKYGDAFYILDLDHFQKNFIELRNVFSERYPKFNIAYSYKTNYIPQICKKVDELGGYAEVVSDMEMKIAQNSGVKLNRIIFNGPYKKENTVEKILLEGGTVNVDSICEIPMINGIISKNPGKKLNIGVRLNFDINDGINSRFGIDVES